MDATLISSFNEANERQCNLIKLPEYSVGQAIGFFVPFISPVYWKKSGLTLADYLLYAVTDNALHNIYSSIGQFGTCRNGFPEYFFGQLTGSYISKCCNFLPDKRFF